MKKKFIFIAAIILLMCSAVYGLYLFTVHPVIKNSIYRSAQLSGNNLQKNINTYHFKSIINLRGEAPKKKWYKTESNISKKNNVKLYDVRLSAYKFPVVTEVDSLVHILQTAEKPILLHCQSGADRAGLASALAIALEKDASLTDIETQISWKYFVNPFNSQSTGKLFFSAYERFLHENGLTHNRENLLSWIKNDYIDHKGNIEFAIDYADNERFDHSRSEDRRSVVIRKGLNKIVLKGWAFDYRRKMPIKYFSISVAGKMYSSVQFSVDRPGVAAYYNLDKKDFENFKFGWVADMDIKHLEKGCYTLSFQVGDDSKSIRRVEDTGYDLFIK